jgi:adenylate cyclase
VVAAPILNRHGEVIGALYGDRCHSRHGVFAPITKLEAMLVELLASGVAAGLARVEQEQAALRARVQFEQFFTPELARELTAHPELLNGKELDVTVLVCDIRGFSRVTERLGPARTMDWINDVLGVLSNCVLQQGGVLVDYVGDELEAMFGAPVGHADHAQRACRAALAMLDTLPQLQQRWLEATQEPMGVGIGINSGSARVGNIGSAQKFKYGPLGNTVNLASRVQGASKYLKATLLITEETRAHLGEGFATRRLCRVRVVNIDKPVAIFELVDTPIQSWLELKDTYEQALACFENKEFLQTAHLLGKLLPRHPSDGPTQALLSRAVTCLLEEPKDFDAVWKLPGK